MTFHQNCLQWLSQGLSELYYEYSSGGDSFYRGTPPISHSDWEKLPNDKKAQLIEKTLNQKELRIRYPGTFSGPSSENLRLLAGLDRVEHLYIDSMQATTFAALLDLPNLQSVVLDVFSHKDGYTNNEWCVFDALIYTRSVEFKCKLNDIKRYRKELDLHKPFAQNPALAKANVEEGPDLGFITEEYLYKNYSLK